MFINLVLKLKIFYLPFQNCKHYALSYILFELLDDEHGTPISQKNVKCNSPGLALAINPTSPRGNFVHYNFPIQHYISHKMKYVSPLRVAALAGNIMLYTLPTK